MAEEGRISEFVEYVVSSLVEDPDSVTVTDSFEDGELFVEIEVPAGDRGRVIGRQGRVIRSLRVIVRAAAGREDLRANVDVLE